MPRYMFDAILYDCGVDVVLAYVYLTSEFHRHRRRYQDREKFYFSLSELQRESGLRDFYAILGRLQKGWRFSGGVTLFEYSGYRKIFVTDWSCGDEDSGNNAAAMIERERSIAESAAKLMAERNVTSKKKHKRVGTGVGCMLLDRDEMVALSGDAELFMLGWSKFRNNLAEVNTYQERTLIKLYKNIKDYPVRWRAWP
jgi:hypothetical protein